MTKVYNKCYYFVATQNGQSFYQEGSYTEQEISRWINDFDIDEFINDEATDEEFCGPAEGHYSVYRQASLTDEEAVDIGYAYMRGDSIVYDHSVRTALAIAKYEVRKLEIQAEVDAEFPDDGLIVTKSFDKVVA
jgi:hypothetical protein